MRMLLTPCCKSVPSSFVNQGGCLSVVLRAEALNLLELIFNEFFACQLLHVQKCSLPGFIHDPTPVWKLFSSQLLQALHLLVARCGWAGAPCNSALWCVGTGSLQQGTLEEWCVQNLGKAPCHSGLGRRACCTTHLSSSSLVCHLPWATCTHELGHHSTMGARTKAMLAARLAALKRVSRPPRPRSARTAQPAGAEAPPTSDAAASTAAPGASTTAGPATASTTVDAPTTAADTASPGSSTTAAVPAPPAAPTLPAAAAATVPAGAAPAPVQQPPPEPQAQLQPAEMQVVLAQEPPAQPQPPAAEPAAPAAKPVTVPPPPPPPARPTARPSTRAASPAAAAGKTMAAAADRPRAKCTAADRARAAAKRTEPEQASMEDLFGAESELGDPPSDLGECTDAEDSGEPPAERT